MNDLSKVKKYITINPRTTSIELNLPARFSQYSQELLEQIRANFSFSMMDSQLEDSIQAFVDEFLKDKAESGA